jgi:hypothetical protein
MSFGLPPLAAKKHGREVLGNIGDRVSYAVLVDHPAPASLAVVDPLTFSGGSRKR